jgi:hypothetical protein
MIDLNCSRAVVHQVHLMSGGGARGLASPGTLWSGSVFLGADTFLGPLYLGVGAGGSGHWSVYLLLGVP